MDVFVLEAMIEELVALEMESKPLIAGVYTNSSTIEMAPWTHLRLGLQLKNLISR